LMASDNSINSLGSFLDNVKITSLGYNSMIVQTGGLPSGSVFPPGTTTNTFEVELTEGNTISCSFDVEVLSGVEATATANPNPICQGGTVNLDVTAASSYQWTGPNSFTSVLKNPVVSNIQTGGLYRVTVTDVNGCTDTTSINVVVNPTPTAVSAPSSQTICSGAAISPIVLTGAVTGTTFNWTRNNTATVIGIAASGSGNISGVLTNTTSAPVTVTFTITPSAGGCSGTAITATVVVNPIPAAVATPSTQSICTGSAITAIVLSSAVTGTTYAWTRNNTATVTGIAASGSGNISGTLVNTTNAPLTVTFTITPTASGCSGTPITATVTVNPNITITATPTTQSVCSGEAISTITMGGALPGGTYNWTRNNTATVTGIAASGTGNISGILVNTTNAPVTVTFTISSNTNGCISNPLSATVIVNPAPAGTMMISPSPACVGSTIQLSATGGAFYTWSGPQGWSSLVQNPTLLLTSHIQAGKYYVTVTNANGCSTSLVSELEVFYPPVATTSYDVATACIGSNLALHGTGAGSYMWSGPAGFASNLKDPVINNVSAANSGLYTLIVTAPNGCTATSLMNVTIHAAPALSANPTLTQTCEGSSVQLFATGSGSFVWTGPATYTSTMQNPVIHNIPIHMSGLYKVNLTANTGCVSTTSVEIKVYDQIHAIATATPQTICEGQSLQLHGEGGSKYLWNGPNGFNSGESDPRIDNITMAQSGLYTVYVYNDGGCFGYAEINVTILPAAKGSAYASPNPVVEYNNVQLFTGTTGLSYSWTGPNGFTSNVQNPVINKVTRYMAGVYIVTIINENGCPTIARANLRVLFTNKGGQSIITSDEDLNVRTETTSVVYPNPTNDILYFQEESSAAIEYSIYDTNGKVQTTLRTTSDKYISTSALANGVYQIRWKPQDSKEWRESKFVKIQ